MRFPAPEILKSDALSAQGIFPLYLFGTAFQLNALLSEARLTREATLAVSAQPVARLWKQGRGLNGVQVMACLRNPAISWAGSSHPKKRSRQRRRTLPQLIKANARKVVRALNLVLLPWEEN